MFDSVIEINITEGKTYIIPRKNCSNKQIAVYITTAILSIQRDELEEVKKEGDVEIINICISNNQKEMKVKSTFDKPNATYILSETLSKIVKTI